MDHVLSARPMVRSYITSLEDRIQELEKFLAPHAPAEEPPAVDTIVVARPENSEEDNQPVQLWTDEISPFPPHEPSLEPGEVAPTAGIAVEQPVEQSIGRPVETQYPSSISMNHEPRPKSPHSQNPISFQQQFDSDTTAAEQPISPWPSTELSPKKRPNLQYFGTNTEVAFVLDEGGAGQISMSTVDEGHGPRAALSQVPVPTQEYLINLYWSRYNKEMLLVNKAQFLQDQKNGYSTFYSHYLCLVMLTMGLRFADPTRVDVKTMQLGDRLTTLHKLARTLVESESVRLRGLPTIQALLILGDLEFHVGRSETAWIYAGECVRRLLVYLHSIYRCQKKG